MKPFSRPRKRRKPKVKHVTPVEAQKDLNLTYRRGMSDVDLSTPRAKQEEGRQDVPLADADRLCVYRGAVSYFDEPYPQRGLQAPGLFARYYFNADGLEVGHYLYDLRTVAFMNPPRPWGIEKGKARRLAPLD